MRIDKLVTATALIAGTLSIANHGALADWSVGIGAEHFDWKETTTPAVEESGVRRVFTANWTQNNATGFLAAYRFKTYMGDVDYTGALLVSGVPVNSTTKYWHVERDPGNLPPCRPHCGIRFWIGLRLLAARPVPLPARRLRYCLSKARRQY
mgnify:CR=1 FL=1